MGREFERTDALEVDATPEEVWTAIATGPGIDSWFMGRNEVDAEHQTVRQHFGGYQPEYRVTTWEPLHRFAYGSDPAPDGRFVAYEFLVEGREGASTVLRMATSGFLPGDDWAAEYEAMRGGGDLFFATLTAYLRHFPGRTATPVTAFGPNIADWPTARATLLDALGLPADPRQDHPVHTELPGPGPIHGEVYFANEQTIGLRTSGALYRFMKGFPNTIVAGHHLFTEPTDPGAAQRAWQTWLDTTFAGKAANS